MFIHNNFRFYYLEIITNSLTSCDRHFKSERLSLMLKGQRTKSWRIEI